MLPESENWTRSQIEAAFGPGHGWTSPTGTSATVWPTASYHLLWFDEAATDADVRRLWEARKGRQAYPVVLLAPSRDASKVRVAGPQDARPVRTLAAAKVLDLLETCQGRTAREAASFLSREFNRLEEAVLPGLRVKDLLTPHFVQERLRRAADMQWLSGAVGGAARNGIVAWRSLFQGMGYQVKQLPQRGYLLRYDDVPVAVVLPYRDPSRFSRLTENGELPEGLLLSDCQRHGAYWGILTADGRYRLFQVRPSVGAATGQYLELDTGELESHDRFYMGLLAPESLKQGGRLTGWVEEARDFGEELRKGLERSTSPCWIRQWAALTFSLRPWTE